MCVAVAQVIRAALFEGVQGSPRPEQGSESWIADERGACVGGQIGPFTCSLVLDEVEGVEVPDA
jgi:hypothetical protein